MESPKHWDPMKSGTHVWSVDLTAGSPEYKEVQDSFFKTMQQKRTIVKV